MINCVYHNGLLFAEEASVILLEPLLLMPVGTIKARGNLLSLELQGPSIRAWQRVFAEVASAILLKPSMAVDICLFCREFARVARVISCFFQ